MNEENQERSSKEKLKVFVANKVLAPLMLIGSIAHTTFIAKEKMNSNNEIKEPKAATNNEEYQQKTKSNIELDTSEIKYRKVGEDTYVVDNKKGKSWQGIVESEGINSSIER
ncbi:MAG: hypothetical protein RIC95_09565 [Vicingaceae bacterium]